MIRTFKLRDAVSLPRMSRNGISFDCRTLHTAPLHPLRYAALANVLPARIPETPLLVQNGKIAGFGQLTHRRGCTSARLRFFAPRTFLFEEAGTALLEALFAEAGHRQAQYLLAEADENSAECNYLRQQGFSVYARQKIWVGTSLQGTSEFAFSGQLRPLTETDFAAVLALYSSTVPGMVQQVEGVFRPIAGWGLFEENALVGTLLIWKGSLGTWMEPLFHPGAHKVTGWIASLIREFSIRPDHPLYICVRSYQDWLGEILESIGFTFEKDQAVLARRMVVPIPIAQTIPLPAVESGIPNATGVRSPISKNTYDAPATNYR